MWPRHAIFSLRKKGRGKGGGLRDELKDRCVRRWLGDARIIFYISGNLN